MAKPTTHTFGEFLVKLGDGADPEVFAAPCGLTSKGFNQTANTQKTAVPDCDDPDAPAYNETAVDTIDSEISGSGILAEEAFDTWQDWFASAASKNYRVYPMGSAGGYYAGKGVLSAFNMTVQRGQKLNVDVTITGDGAYVWTAP
jgi:hypothetical protein